MGGRVDIERRNRLQGVEFKPQSCERKIPQPATLHPDSPDALLGVSGRGDTCIVQGKIGGVTLHVFTHFCLYLKYKHIHTHIYIYIHAYLYVHERISTYNNYQMSYSSACVCVCVCEGVCVCLFVCAPVFKLCACMHVCMYTSTVTEFSEDQYVGAKASGQRAPRLGSTWAWGGRFSASGLGLLGA